MNHSPLATPSVHPPTGYSHATRVGNPLFIAGQIAKDELTTFTVDSRYRSAIAEVRARYCKEYLPPNSFVVVAGLAEPEFLLEIEAIAALSAESQGYDGATPPARPLLFSKTP